MTGLAEVVAELARARVDLEGMKVPGGAPMTRIGGRPSRGEVVPAPVAVHVLDAVARIDATVTDQYWIVASTIGRTSKCAHLSDPARATLTRLHFVGEVAGELSTNHVMVAKDVSIMFQSVTASAQALTGELASPYLLANACSGCGEQSLWFDPGSHRVRCSSPDCGRTWVGIDPK